MNKYFKKIANTKSILSWKSKGLSDVIKSSTIIITVLLQSFNILVKKYL